MLTCWRCQDQTDRLYSSQLCLDCYVPIAEEDGNTKVITSFEEYMELARHLEQALPTKVPEFSRPICITKVK